MLAIVASNTEIAAISTPTKIWDDENNPGHPWCKGKFYISGNDVGIKQVALSLSISKATFSFTYEDAAPPADMAVHLFGHRCKIISIWVN